MWRALSTASGWLFGDSGSSASFDLPSSRKQVMKNRMEPKSEWDHEPLWYVDATKLDLLMP